MLAETTKPVSGRCLGGVGLMNECLCLTPPHPQGDKVGQEEAGRSVTVEALGSMSDLQRAFSVLLAQFPFSASKGCPPA